MNLLNQIPDELLLTVDAMNTLNGGKAEDSIRFREVDGTFEVSIKVPGAQKDSFKIVINDEVISVVHMLAFDTLKKTTLVPRPIWNKRLPLNADTKNVHARFEEGCLYITIPLDGYNNGNQREIEIY